MMKVVYVEKSDQLESKNVPKNANMYPRVLKFEKRKKKGEGRRWGGGKPDSGPDLLEIS